MKGKKYCLGIDLGTTNCCVCYFENGLCHIVEDGIKRTTESLVGYDENQQKYVGDSARSRMGTIPVYSLTKLVIGRTDDEIKKLASSQINKLPFKIKTSGDKVMLVIDNLEKTPIQVAADILSYLKKNAENKLGCDISDAVITVPAHFNDDQRQATKAAAEVAGLNVLRIINEPTAAAIAYTSNKKYSSRNFLVFDFGGGTFDVSVVNFNNDVIEVLSTDGDLFLGGSHLDEEIRSLFVSKIKNDHGFDPMLTTFNANKLTEAAEKIKKELSVNVSASAQVLLMNKDKIVSPSLELSRSSFEKLARSYVQRTIEITRKALQAAAKKTGVDSVKVDDIVLVGGSTRIPLVKELLQKEFPSVVIDSSSNPDEIVAMGAAIQGAKLTGDQTSPDILLLDVTPLSLGIETQGGVMAKLIEANATIPIQKSQVFTTAADNQTAVSIHVFQGERTMCNDNKLIGNFDLSGIAPARAGTPQIEVTFDIDANGILNVSAKDKASGKAHSVKIQTKGSLSKEEMERMKAEAEQYKEEDQKRLALATKKNDCERLIISVESQIQDNKGKVPEQLENSISEQIKNLRSAIDNSSMEDMEKYEKELSNSSNELYQVLSQQNNGGSGQSSDGQTSGSESQA